MIGQMIRLMLEAGGIQTLDRTTLGATPVVRKAIIAGEIDHLRRVHGQRRVLLQHGRGPGLEGFPQGLCARLEARL